MVKGKILSLLLYISMTVFGTAGCNLDGSQFTEETEMITEKAENDENASKMEIEAEKEAAEETEKETEAWD